MRTHLVASLVVLMLPACIGEIADSGDDPGSGYGSGSGSGSDPETPTARVTGAFDKTAITTELAKTETVTLMLTSENGFGGDVTLVARVVDASDVEVPGVTVTGPPSVTVAVGGMATAEYQIEVPMNAVGATVNGSLKVDLASGGGSASVQTPLTIDAVYSVDYAAGTGATANKHMNAQVANLRVKQGAILRFHNSDLIEHVIYGGGAFTNYHENTVSGGAPGRTYDIPTINIAKGSSGRLGCFNHTANTYSTYAVE